MAHIEDNVCGFWDRQRIEQIVGHLVGNAIKYGAGRPIELIVARFKGMAILRVTDQGIGITPDSVERIFGRFERATSIRSYGGFGLGLYITREIISAHGGVLEVISTPEQGASFEVHLPLSCKPQLPSRPARTPTGAAPI
jgi:signal transduction histidine kinase